MLRKLKNLFPSRSHVHFIFTGGTIDSYWESTKDTAVPRKKSIIPTYLKKLKLHVKCSFTQLTMKDSRDITEQDREKIVRETQKISSKKIIITHGTYTMADTASYLQRKLGKTNKTIILIGSFIPISGFAPSDGPFNIGYALAKLDHLPPGVYVGMNGKIFKAGTVSKHIKKGRFEKKN